MVMKNHGYDAAHITWNKPGSTIAGWQKYYEKKNAHDICQIAFL